MARSNSGWIWYFVLLGVLSILATTILVVYNLRQQLKPEQLEAAQKLWQEKGPRSYREVYTVKIGDAEEVDRYEVTVKDGKVVEAMVNGQPEPAQRFHWYGMDRLFADIETNLERDQKKGQPRTYTRAAFDANNGAVRWYVRHVMGTRERVEITVEGLTPDD